MAVPNFHGRDSAWLRRPCDALRAWLSPAVTPSDAQNAARLASIGQCGPSVNVPPFDHAGTAASPPDQATGPAPGPPRADIRSRSRRASLLGRHSRLGILPDHERRADGARRQLPGWSTTSARTTPEPHSGCARRPRQVVADTSSDVAPVISTARSPMNVSAAARVCSSSKPVVPRDRRQRRAASIGRAHSGIRAGTGVLAVTARHEGGLRTHQPAVPHTRIRSV